ncbi:cyclin-dependent kinase G-2-like isoform X1, partial [Haematococcus lacustris]
MGRLLDAMPRCFSLPEVKCLVQQLLRAVAHLHRCWVVHRDIKAIDLKRQLLQERERDRRLGTYFG